MSIKGLSSPELKAMCGSARTVAKMCDAIALEGEYPRMGIPWPEFVRFSNEHPFLADDYDPDQDPYIWELPDA